MAVKYSSASPVVRRAQVPLTQDDVDALGEVLSGHTHREFLAALRLVPPAGDVTESLVLHALMEVGIRTLREASDAAGYARLAAEPEYQKHAIARRDNRQLRRRPPYADEP